MSKKNNTPRGNNQPLVLNQIVIKAPSREIVDVGKWREALKSADRGKRTKLYDLYEDVMLDTLLSSAIDKRRMAITNADIAFTVNDKSVDEMDMLIDSPEFEDLLEMIFDSKMWGHSLIEFDFANGFNPVLIPRKHVDPVAKIIRINQTDETGISYAEDPFFLEVGDAKDLGVILKAIPYAIYKRGGFGDFAQAVELFGVPFRKATYNSWEPGQREEVLKALEAAGGAPYAAIPEGSNLEFVANSTNVNANLYTNFIKSCNEEMLYAIVGQTMTTQNGSSKSQSDTHKEVEEGINKADRRFIQRILNTKLIPLLESRGYPVKGGWFSFVEGGESISLTDRIEIDTQIAQRVRIPDSYWYETYGIPMPEDGNTAVTQPTEPTPPTNKKLMDDVGTNNNSPDNDSPNLWQRLMNFFPLAHATRTHTSSVGHPVGANNHSPLHLSDTSLPSFTSIITDLATRIHSGNLDFAAVPEELANQTISLLFSEVDSIMPDVGTDEAWKSSWYNLQQHSIYKFGLAKSYSQLKAMRNAIVQPNGETKPFTEFLKDCQAINAKYNTDWLETEYIDVVKGGTMGVEWMDIQDTKEAYPYLQYVDAGDSRVREEHHKLNGIIEPVDSPFWQQFLPANGHRCRCRVRRLTAAQAKELGYSKDQHADNMRAAEAAVKDKYWRKSPTAAVIDADKTAYIKDMPTGTKAQLKAVENYGMKPVEKIYLDGRHNMPSADIYSKDDAVKWLSNTSIRNLANLPVTVPESIARKMAETDLIRFAPNISKAVLSPSEVWSVFDGKANSLVYLRYTADNPVAVITDFAGEVKSFRVLTNEELAKADNLRRGVLIKR